MEFVQTFILIVMLVGGHGPNTGVAITGIEFRSQERCKEAVIKIINTNVGSKIRAFCIEK